MSPHSALTYLPDTLSSRTYVKISIEYEGLALRIAIVVLSNSSFFVFWVSAKT